MKYSLKCPHCGQYKSFRTTMSTVVEIENGYIESSEIIDRLNIYETMDCKGCGFSGIVALFLQGDKTTNPSGISYVNDIFSIKSKEEESGETNS